MHTYILIIGFWAGALSGGDSVALTNATFTSLEKCEAAGRFATKQFDTPFKTIKYICVEQ